MDLLQLPDYLEQLMLGLVTLVNESQVLSIQDGEGSRKELPDTLRNLGSPCEVGVDGAIVYSG
jgi:hypothetical protein